MVQCDVEWHDGTPVAPVAAPGAEGAGREGAARWASSRCSARSSSSSSSARPTLEAHAKHYHDLTPSVPYILDYHILAASFDEPFLRAVRTSMKAAGMIVESSKGEAWAGQHEINFRLRGRAARPPTTTSSTRPGSRRSRTSAAVGHLHGEAATTTWVGSSCHIHSSLWRDGETAFAGEIGRLQATTSPGRSRCAGASSRSSSRRRSTRTSASPPGAGRRRRSPGATTTARAASASSATARRCGRRRGSPAPTRTRTSRSRRCSPPGCTGSRRSSSSGRRSRGTRTSRTSSASRTRCARRSRGSSRATSRGGCSATR